jgi:general secretion pathway protein G
MKRRGFTLIEVLVVMAIIATLLTIAVPRYFGSLQRSQEAALRQDLAVIRDALDKFKSDAGAFPNSLDELVQKGYLRAIPPDPITESPATWLIIPPVDPEAKGLVSDIRSGAPGTALDGSDYGQW